MRREDLLLCFQGRTVPCGPAHSRTSLQFMTQDCLYCHLAPCALLSLPSVHSHNPCAFETINYSPHFMFIYSTLGRQLACSSYSPSLASGLTQAAGIAPATLWSCQDHLPPAGSSISLSLLHPIISVSHPNYVLSRFVPTRLDDHVSVCSPMLSLPTKRLSSPLLILLFPCWANGRACGTKSLLPMALIFYPHHTLMGRRICHFPIYR